MVYSLESGWLLNYDVKSTELYCHVANKSMEELGWDFLVLWDFARGSNIEGTFRFLVTTRSSAWFL